MKAFYFWIFLFFTPLIASESWNTKNSEGFVATATLSAAEVTLPEPFVIELKLTYPSGYHIDEKALLSNLLRNPRPGAPPFLLLSSHKESFSGSDTSKINEKWTFHLEPQLPGKYGLTFLNIPFFLKDSQGRPVELNSGIFDINVILPPTVDRTFLPQEALLNLSNTFPIDLSPKLRAALQQNAFENEPALNWSRWKAKKFPWETALAILAFLGAFLYYKYAPRKKLQSSPTMLPSQLHYHAANEKLATLQQQTEINPSLAESYIVELSNAVRSEIEEKYHLKVLPDTTEEFFAQLKHADILDPAKLEKLIEFTRLADRVKYASHIPTLQECLAAQTAAASIFH